MSLQPKRTKRKRGTKRNPTDSSHVRHINVGNSIIPRALCGRKDVQLFTNDLSVLNLCKHCHDRSPEAQAITRGRIRRILEG
ncbi:MAG: hypothetical protein ACXACT_14535 [Candidatus Thorarchaeota archaeon]